MRLDEDDKDDEDEDESEPTELYLHQNTMFEITEPGTFIGMKSHLMQLNHFLIISQRKWTYYS